MAKIEPNIDSTNVETQDKNQEIPTNIDLNAILQRLDEQDKLIKELTSPSEDNGKNIYKGPRKYSFKIFDGKPVLDYTSFKKDNTRDWKYKTIQGQEITNQWLKLTLWNFNKNEEEIMEVAFDNFVEGYNSSEKMFADIKQKGEEILYYTFTTTDYGMFNVKPNIIN